jgi:hypothetical protein
MSDLNRQFLPSLQQFFRNIHTFPWACAVIRAAIKITDNPVQTIRSKKPRAFLHGATFFP